MKKYIPLLILTIAIAAILFFTLKNSNALNMPIANEITRKVPVKFPIKIENNSLKVELKVCYFSIQKIKCVN